MILEYICDTKRHLICIPYSIENLHLMAKDLDIKRVWYRTGKKKKHPGKLLKPHYDIPARRIEEIMRKCRVLTDREILNIIKNE